MDKEKKISIPCCEIGEDGQDGGQEDVVVHRHQSTASKETVTGRLSDGYDIFWFILPCPTVNRQHGTGNAASLS